MYKKSSTGWLKHLDFMVLDIICLQLAFVMGYFLRHHSFKPYGSPIYRNEAIVFALIQLMIMFFDDSFKNVMKRGYLVEIGMTVKNMVYIIVLGVFYLFLIQEGDQFSRATIMLTGALYGMLSYLMRIGWKAVVKKRSSGEHSGRSLLIITTEKQSQSVVKSMLQGHQRFVKAADGIRGVHLGSGVDGLVVVGNADPRRTGGIEPCRCS